MKGVENVAYNVENNINLQMEPLKKGKKISLKLFTNKGKRDNII